MKKLLLNLKEFIKRHEFAFCWVSMILVIPITFVSFMLYAAGGHSIIETGFLEDGFVFDPFNYLHMVYLMADIGLISVALYLIKGLFAISGLIVETARRIANWFRKKC